ncbi:hypothetical protein KC19_6G009500 [Ceratodon purpureus]|uniref:1,4-dihydroxy-2-naphthoate octaprenyltransferase n=1 Tax=Ceratodon purpureus TaxID=3225 RepID=A0A8T0HBJ7_CERPU|nr:hypothetical protein KC19_6G009500 [Ceratodon purpureus]
MLAPILVLLDSVNAGFNGSIDPSLMEISSVMGSRKQRSRLLSQIRILLQLGRVRFLVYSPIAYAAGVTCATANTSDPCFSIWLFLVGQVFVSATHMLTHFFNEYYDLAADSLHEFPSPWTGGSRVLVAGKVRPLTSYRLGCTLTVLMLALLTIIPNMETRLLGVVIVVFAVGYSTPPLQLGNRGLGEADVMLVLNILVPLFGYSLFRNSHSSAILLLAMIPPAIVEFVRMMVMNMADVVGDTRARKLTLVVRLGLEHSVRIHMFGMGLAYFTLVTLFLLNYIQWAVFLLELSTLPIGALICWRLFQRQEYLSLIKFYNLPFVSTQHNGLILIAAVVGLVWGDEKRGVMSAMSQVRLLGVWFFLVQFGVKAWLGWRRGSLAAVFNPQIAVGERVAKSAQIEEWERGIAQAARPFCHNDKQRQD